MITRFQPLTAAHCIQAGVPEGTPTDVLLVRSLLLTFTHYACQLDGCTVPTSP
jgi:hypothetical protein